jgi:hypothetical protein
LFNLPHTNGADYFKYGNFNGLTDFKEYKMAEKLVTKTKTAEGHGDNTAPAGIESPATFIPLSPTPSSVNNKSADLGSKGEQK